MTQIFISYRRADSQSNTDRIYEQLVRAFGHETIFKDVDDIPLGADFPSHLDEVIRDSKVVIVIIGRTWATSRDDEGNLRLENPKDFVRIEIESALNLPNIRVIPVLVNGAVMPSAEQLPDSLHPLLRLNAIDIRNDPDFVNDIERLIRKLQQFGIQAKRSPTIMIAVAALIITIVIAGILGVNSFLDSVNTSETPETLVAEAQTEEIIQEISDVSTNTPVPTLTDEASPSLSPTETPTLSATEREETVQAEMEIIVAEVEGTQAEVERQTEVAGTAHAQMTVYAGETQNAYETATVAAYTDTPTPNTRQTAQARLTLEAATVTQAWIDSWTATPSDTPIPSSSTPLGGSGQLIFSRWNADGDQHNIFLLDLATGQETQLTDGRVNQAESVVWSPDGSQIAFESTQDNAVEIYVMDSNGSNQQRLTNNLYGNWLPVWSPDGSQIAFRSFRDGNDEIYVMDADGSNQRNLTNNVAIDDAPVWSPDGSQIAFRSYRDGNWEIYLMNADGSNQRNLTNDVEYDFNPVWSPDASQIAFVSYRDGNDEIYVINVDGPNQRNLTNNMANDGSPDWSPDGSQIAFQSGQDGNYEIYVMNADGSNQQRLTNDTPHNLSPAWSPDGSQIAFQSGRDGNWEIYLMDADGSNVRRITNTAEGELYPQWQPVAR